MMTALQQYAETLEEKDTALKDALLQLNQQVEDFIETKFDQNSPVEAKQLWEAWENLKRNFRLDEKRYPDDYLWMSPQIEATLLSVTKGHAFNKGENDPISLAPMTTLITTRGANQYDALTLLGHFQAGHRRDPLTQRRFSSDEFSQLTQQLITECYAGNMPRENSWIAWHVDILKELINRSPLLCVMLLLSLGGLVLSEFDFLEPIVALPILLSLVLVVEKVYGNIFVTSRNSDMELPIALAVYQPRGM